MITHRRIRQPHRAVAVHQPRQNPSRRTPCFFGASRSLRNIASIAAVKGSSLGASRCGTFRGGGIADSSAWRTVRRCTPCLSATPGSTIPRPHDRGGSPRHDPDGVLDGSGVASSPNSWLDAAASPQTTPVSRRR
jgi:hypothetical protein